MQLELNMFDQISFEDAKKWWIDLKSKDAYKGNCCYASMINETGLTPCPFKHLDSHQPWQRDPRWKHLPVCAKNTGQSHDSFKYCFMKKFFREHSSKYYEILLGDMFKSNPESFIEAQKLYKDKNGLWVNKYLDRFWGEA